MQLAREKYISDICENIPKAIKDDRGNAWVSIQQTSDGNCKYIPLERSIRFSASNCENCLIIVDITNKCNNFAINASNVYGGLLYIGKNNQLNHTGITLADGFDLSCVIGENNIFWGLSARVSDCYGIKIGNSGRFAAGLAIRAGQTHTLKNKITGKFHNLPKNCVEIGNHVWVALNVIISGRASIPGNSIIAAKSFVNSKFFEECCLIGGIPAKVLRRNVSWEDPTPLKKLVQSYCKENNIAFSWRFGKIALEANASMFEDCAIASDEILSPPPHTAPHSYHSGTQLDIFNNDKLADIVCCINSSKTIEESLKYEIDRNNKILQELKQMASSSFKYINSFKDYMLCLNENKNSLIIIIALKAMDNCKKFGYLDQDYIKELGLNINFIGEFRKNYICIIKNNQIYKEEISKNDENLEINFPTEMGMIKVISASYNSGDKAEVWIDGKNVAINKRGLNFVILDRSGAFVLDSVCFDIGLLDSPGSREKG